VSEHDNTGTWNWIAFDGQGAMLDMETDFPSPDAAKRAAETALGLGVSLRPVGLR
jgi:hypothetical protein